jgi:hypothetical protein
MFAPHLSRLLTVGLAACAVTWALAATALAGPGPTPPYLSDQANRPGYKDVAGDQKEPQSAARPAFKVVPGDVKAPQSAGRPAFKLVAGDVKSDADRARSVAPVVLAAPQVAAPAPDDDTGTIALIIAIAAIVTALGAMTLTVTRQPRGALRA